MLEKYTWESSENAELWEHDIFETIEECIADAKENYDYKKGETVYVGETVQFSICVDAERVLENLEEESYEFAGEAADNWDAYDYKNTEELRELEEKLTEVVVNWLRKYNREPNFYQINNIRPIEIN